MATLTVLPVRCRETDYNLTWRKSDGLQAQSREIISRHLGRNVNSLAERALDVGGIFSLIVS